LMLNGENRNQHQTTVITSYSRTNDILGDEYNHQPLVVSIIYSIILIYYVIALLFSCFFSSLICMSIMRLWFRITPWLPYYYWHRVKWLAINVKITLNQPHHRHHSNRFAVAQPTKEVHTKKSLDTPFTVISPRRKMPTDMLNHWDRPSKPFPQHIQVLHIIHF
jgi:hypothetical protein